MIDGIQNAEVLTRDLTHIKELSLPLYNSHALFQGKEEVIIMHLGKTYRLSKTKQGKLILTK